MLPIDHIHIILGALFAVVALAILALFITKAISKEARCLADARRKARSPQVVVWTQTPLTEPELIRIFKEWEPTDQRLRAVLQVIEEERANAISEVSAFSLANVPGELAHTAGGIEWLGVLQGNMERLLDGVARGSFKPSELANPDAEEAA